MRDYIHLFVNGRECRIGGRDAFQALASHLRLGRGETGTKIVCEEGDCGACTVLVGGPHGGGLAYRPINSCIQFLFQLDGTHVVTVEGLAAEGELSAIQSAMVAGHGAQCGYCTPGFVVAMTGLAEANPHVSERDVREGLTGNLCRCTGYEPIIKAALAASRETQPKLSDLYPSAPIAESLRRGADDVRVDADGRVFFGPATLDAATGFLAEHPDTAIVQGGTDFGVLFNKRGFRPSVVMSLARVSGLDEIAVDGASLVVGGRVTLADLEAFTRDAAPELHRILGLFGSPQIRNAGTLAGNIANGSPIADTLPLLFVSDAQIDLASVRGTRTMAVGGFYLGYKTLAKEPDEIITRIRIPLPASDETLRLYKVSKRRDLDISTFTAAIRMRIDDSRMSSVKIAYGGVSQVVLRLPRTEAYLETHAASEDAFRAAGEIARGEIAPISDVRGSAAFRSQLAGNILMKFYWEEVSRERETAVS